MTLELSSHEISFDVRGVTFTRTSLKIADQEAFVRAGYFLESVESFAQFWLGDYLLFAERYNLKTVFESAHKSLHRSTIYSYVEVARLFRPEDRHEKLSFGHHAAIRYILGEDANIEEALNWLKIAAEENYTVGDLREAMRVARRDGGNDPGPMRGIVRITDFQKISRWSEKIHVADLPTEEADEIRRCTQPLFQFLCELHRKPFSFNENVSLKQSA